MSREKTPRVELRPVPGAEEPTLWARKAVYAEGGNQAIGYCVLSPLEKPRRDKAETGSTPAGEGKIAEIRFGLDPAHRGRGYAGQAVRQCLEQAFAAGMEAVYAGIEGGNAKAIALVIKIGFGIEGERRNPTSGRNEILFSLEKNRP